jgi:hypothetical protein
MIRARDLAVAGAIQLMLPAADPPTGRVHKLHHLVEVLDAW